MSSSTMGSSQPPTTKSGLKMDGRFRSGMQPHNHSGSHVPETPGFRWGLAELVSSEMRRSKGYREVRIRCTSCGTQKWVNYDNLRAGRTQGCQPCRQKCGAPAWLLQRMEAARQRCTNPNDGGYKRYGARGIQFRFPSVAEAAVWVMTNLGLHRDKELDRIDNNGHYEPGNLRWVSRKQNVANQGRSKSKTFHLFRATHPEVRYADNTLRNLLSKGLTFEEIVDRWNRPSDKPKGVYGTCSTADPDIVSLLTDASCPTVSSALDSGRGGVPSSV